eukprot:6018323-Prymnesium_polylepis.1
MLAAFPEANMVCPLGVDPRLCARRGEYFKSLEQGLELMVAEAKSIYAEVLRKKNTLTLAGNSQPPQLASRPPTSLATWSTWARV